MDLNKNNSDKLVDLFGNNIDFPNNGDEYPFLIILSDNVTNYLSKTNNPNIYKYNMKNVMKLLKYNNIVNKSNYLPAGFILIKDYMPTQLLLINKQICIAYNPDNFNKVALINGGSLWKNNKPSLSLLYSDTDSLSKNSSSNIGIIDDKYLINYKNKYNEFMMLNNSDTSYTIDRNQFKNMNSNSIFKLISDDYLYPTNNTDNEITLKSKNTSNKNQEISYTVQGELKLNNKCITNDNHNVVANQCTGDANQKWYPFDGSFVSQYDTSCLSHESKKVITDDCLNNKSSPNMNEQKWNIEFPHQADPTDYLLSNPLFKGKQVALVSSSDPWYLNKDIVDPVNYEKSDYDTDSLLTYNDVNYSYGIVPEEIYYPNKLLNKINTNNILPLDGIAHKNIKRIENFNDNDNDDSSSFSFASLFKNYLCWIIILLILIVIFTRNK